jgi:hypothetical protein
MFPTIATAQQTQGFAVDRFYPSAPGGGWFVMDDLRISGRLGGAAELTSNYSRNPLVVRTSSGQLALVSSEAFLDIGLAVTRDRYRAYVNAPIPLSVVGQSGILGGNTLTGPALSPGTNPDSIVDPRLGFDVRFFGKPDGLVRLGGSAQLVFPSGARSDYVSDGRYRGMFRFLAAGDAGRFTYAAQLGVHARTLDEPAIPGGPNGSEFLFGGSAGRKISARNGWSAVIGPEVFGETAFHSFFGTDTGVEGLLTVRLERTDRSPGRNLRIKIGAGHGIVQRFGAPEWRVLAGVEFFGQRSGRPGAAGGTH